MCKRVNAPISEHHRGNKFCLLIGAVRLLEHLIFLTFEEPENEIYKHAVVIVRISSHNEEAVVGNVLKLISMVVSMFLSLPRCTLSIEVTVKRVNRGVVYGLEIPVKLHSHGSENAIRWIKTKLNNTEKELCNNSHRCLK